MGVLNIAAYKFVQIAEPARLQPVLQDRCDALELLGTILLAEEGINLFLAGEALAIHLFVDFLKDEQFEHLFDDLDIKPSYSQDRPFKRLKVRLVKEIITMRHPTITPLDSRAPAVSPVALKQWLDAGCDDAGRPVVLLDTRNNFEVEYGTFEKAETMSIEKFSEFPEAVKALLNQPDSQEKTVVSFCTGGIRCEKAALYLKEIGVKNVFQLDGGILRYFEDVGGEHYKGTCFVFDERIALTPALKAEPGAERKSS